MNVSLSVFKANPTKYFDLANEADIIVTRRGKAIGSIKGKKSTMMLAVEALIGSVKLPPEYDDPNYDPNYKLARVESYKVRGLIE